MSSPARSRWHDAAYWGLMLAVCIVFYVLNLWTSFKEDDMEFSLLRDAGFMDFLRARLDHYLTANGRCSDHFATVFCAYLGKPLFNVINTLMFAVMAHLVCILSTGRRSVLALALFIAYVAWFFPVPGQTMLFVAGSCNYMWAITASLLMVYLLRKFASQPNPGKGKTILLVLLAFVAGNFNEATSFGFFGGMVLYYLFNRKEFNRTVLLTLLSYLAGIIIIMGSPGAWNRVQNGGIAVHMGLADLLTSRSYIFGKKMLTCVVPIVAVIVGFIVLVRKGFRPIKNNLWAYILCCLAFVMFVLGYLNDRGYAPLATVAFIIVAMAVDKLLSGGRMAGRLRLAVIIASILLSIVGYAHGLKVLGALKTFEDNIERDINEAPRQAILHEYHFNGGFSRFTLPLCYASDEYFIRESTYCAYYDKDNVQFVNDSVYDRYHSGRLLDGAEVLPLMSDRPEIADTVLGIPGQEYMVVVLNIDTLKPSPQQASYYHVQPENTLSEEEKEYRTKYGLEMEYMPLSYYQLYYQRKHLLLLPLIKSSTSHIVLELDYDGTLGFMTLRRLPQVNTSSPQ